MAEKDKKGTSQKLLCSTASPASGEAGPFRNQLEGERRAPLPASPKQTLHCHVGFSLQEVGSADRKLHQSSAEREVSILGARVWQLFQIPPQEEYWPHCPQTPLSQCGYPTNNSKEDLGMANDSEGHMASLETVSSIPSSLNFRPSRLGLVTSPCTEI